jgi:diadenosine tetraphosphate (Ap4A) HIT family hydrolase
LVLNHAIALKDAGLIQRVLETATTLDLSDQTKLDNHILRHLQTVAEPLRLVRHRRTAAGWLISYNELRALRPPRDSNLAITNIHKAFDATAFNFNMTTGEKFWTGVVEDQAVELFYSKFPLEPYHSLIVPERTANREQYLENRDHQVAWQMAETLGRHQPRLLIGYNTHGGGESINQLHFQYLPTAPDLPLFDDNFVSKYPLPMITATGAAAAWRHIQRHQAHNQPFNLIYRPGLVHIIERNFTGHRPLPNWTGGFAWYELAGGILTLKPEAYASLTDADIAIMFNDLHP